MKAYVVEVRASEYAVEIKQGVQYFRLDYRATKADCQWMAKMFRKALAMHDAEKRKGKC